ncbi:hypothetical protein, unlikely [Trypanosoma brucei brucei TREU927]|uniref:Uncharacterized protein n=2 Tax=Trypanosoma brucei TaxID=5691 RepID=Q38FK4_TRYB2|nr:hypothetical protein, unlikely [Trypanosoma brucei brucei TREU927]EAN76416.1 hypothetical protein, unlikely [Trypanosoma brucei brucei TREU927]RHW70110.1 hypothetical protein DPX39_090010100 [Trypanosoma brucei equiperdum]
MNATQRYLLFWCVPQLRRATNFTANILKRIISVETR